MPVVFEMSTFLFRVVSCCIIFRLATAVTLNIAGSALVGDQFCPGSTAEFKCQTTEGSLLWETSGTTANHVFNNPLQSPAMLGIFSLSLDGITQTTGGKVTAVNSTALVSNVQTSFNGTVLKCSEFSNLNMFHETVLRVSGPPPAPAVNPITVVDEGSINSTLLISWSQSNCAVQYVVTIINSSDDRVYSNITTSNTNTTVTLPTGVEFCVTLVAVDSIDRRGPDTTPVCHFSSQRSSDTVTYTTTTISAATTATSTAATAATATATIFTPDKVSFVLAYVVAVTLTIILTVISIAISSSTVTHHSPVMMGGTNVTAAVAIPVVLVLLLLMISMVLGVILCVRHQRQGQALCGIPLQRMQIMIKRVQVFSCEVKANKWEIVCATYLLKEDDISVKKYFENTGYTCTTDAKPFHVQAQLDEEIVTATVKDNTSGWSVEKLRQDKAAEVEHNFISGEDRALFTTTTFIVSSSQTSPEYDMCVTVTIDGGKTPHTVITVERKASRRCVCQVFYQREEINCWKTTLAFCPERLLDGVKRFYQDSNFGPTVHFYLIYEAKVIDTSISCETKEWNIQMHSEPQQVSRAAVEGYTGEGEPPCIAMTLSSAVSDETTPPKLTLPVTLTGARETNNILVIERTAEEYVCQVFYRKKSINCWIVIFAFFPVHMYDVVKQIYKNATIGPSVNIQLEHVLLAVSPIELEIKKLTKGWNAVRDEDHWKVYKNDIVKYNTKGDKLPHILMQFNPESDKTTPPDLQMITSFTRVNKPELLQIDRIAEPV